MTPGPVVRTVRGGLRRRRMQAVVISLVFLAAASSCVLAVALIADSSSPSLSSRAHEISGIQPIVPFIVAFAVIALVMSVLIVVNIVSGSVLAGYRRIGILKAIGFTPGQVVAAYTGQPLIPALGGCVAGVVLGDVLATPLLDRTASAYGVGHLAVPAWVNAAVPTAILLAAGLAAVVPALRAGRLAPVQAIAAARMPRRRGGGAAYRLLTSLPLPRPVTIGMAATCRLQAGTALVLAAVALGASAVTLAVGLGASLSRVVSALTLTRTEPVEVGLPPVGYPGGTAGAQRAIESALRAQPGTLHYAAEADQSASVAGLSEAVPVIAFRGEARWTGYALISGRWYTGQRQVDVAARFLTLTRSAVGATVTLKFRGQQLPVRIAGEIFDTQGNGLTIITGWRTLAAADPGMVPDQYDVGVAPATRVGPYARALQVRLGPSYPILVKDRQMTGLILVLGVVATLTLLIAAVSALGVLSIVVVQSRERARDLAVFKSVGMTPGQVIAMTVSSVGGTGLVGGLFALPAGTGLHGYLVSVMGALARTAVPTSFVAVYPGWELAALTLAGPVIAVAGALLPASWAASARTISVLRAE
jgi:putative ABC transport system permease protein